MKTCTRCGQHKQLVDFANTKMTRSGKGAECKVCVTQRAQEWAKANPERRKQQAAIYRERHHEELCSKSLAYSRKRQAENPEVVRAIRMKYRNSPKGVEQNRKGLQARRGVPLTQEAWLWWTSLTDRWCHYCDQLATEIDHVVPVTRGGTGERSNLVPACRSCNASKNNRLLEEWMVA